MSASKIEWTDRVWNPVRGCSRVSPGCDNCYAMRQAHRFTTAPRTRDAVALGEHPAPLPGPYAGLTTIRKGKVDWTGAARFVPEMLGAPLKWRKPRRIFVNSMSDLFHHSVTNEQIAAVFGVMAACPQHTFQILTKRPARMAEWMRDITMLLEERAIYDAILQPAAAAMQHSKDSAERWESALDDYGLTDPDAHGMIEFPWPLPNVWLGVSCEDQQRADERVPLLLQTPAAVRFVSAEPLLGPIDFRCIPANYEGAQGDMLDALSGCEYFDQDEPEDRAEPRFPQARVERVDWVIVGGESGPGARPCHGDWIRSIVRQCRDANVACFVKQLGARYEDPINGIGGAQCRPDPTIVTIARLKNRKGGDLFEWPDDLRVREMPEVRHAT